MGNNNLKSTNDILIKTDQNNLIFIDPNSVVSDGVIVPRSVEPENLMVYVNLEADLIPRSILAMSNNQNTLLSIAKGNLNFLQKSTDSTNKDFDTTWTNPYTEFKGNTTNDVFRQNDETGQSFGIDNISIQVGGTNYIPRVSMKFIDVRGKTLFESPENSPYKAFFHLPWPIFYLTIKGYYGKALKYRLHLIKFNSKYNASSGNFEVDASFIGSTYAFMTDIPLEGILNAAYMYKIKVGDPGVKDKNGYVEQKIKRSTKGYQTLRSVYQEYKNKGLLPKDFPVKTLREIIITAGRLNKILETRIFDTIIDHKALSAIKEYEDNFMVLSSAVNIWKSRHIENAYITYPGSPYYQLSDNNKNDISVVVGDGKQSLELAMKNAIKPLDANLVFGLNIDNTLIKDNDLKTHTISLEKLKNIKNFYKQGSDGLGNPVIGVDTEGIQLIIVNASKDYIAQRKNLEDLIEKKMNDIVKDTKLGGIGFEPTIRNIFGVIMANADAYIRLLKDVHQKAFDQGNERKNVLSNVVTDKSTNSEDIYPWPEVKKQGSDGAQSVLMYPGNLEMISKLKSNDPILWPEVDFVENYYQVSTKKSDGLVDKEGSPETLLYVFEDSEPTDNKNLCSFTEVMNIIPYTDKSIVSVLYEIFERGKYLTSFNTFDNETIVELSNIEFDILKLQTGDDYNIINYLNSQIDNLDQFTLKLKENSLFEKYPYLVTQIPTIPYIVDGINKDFEIKKYDKTKNQQIHNDDYKNLSNFLLNYKPEDYRSSIYPFNSKTYLSYLKQASFSPKNLQLNKMLSVDCENGFINSPLDGSMWVKPGVEYGVDYNKNLFNQKLWFRPNKRDIYKPLLNTPYFHKQLYNDFNLNSDVQGKYVGSAYLLLNSLPFVDLDSTTTSFVALDSLNNGQPEIEKTLVSSLFREIGASHFVPYHLILKWGSIYHRYKKSLDPDNPVDIIDGITDEIDVDLFFDKSLGRTYSTISGYTNSVMTVNPVTKNNIGLYPYYQNIFHNIVNGYGFYDQESTGATSGYTETITMGGNKLWYKNIDSTTVWSSFIDNTKYDENNKRYTLLPSNGHREVKVTDFSKSEQDNFRCIWYGDPTDKIDEQAKLLPPNELDQLNYTGYTFPSPKEYIISTGGTYSITSNNKKVIDLIATFKPDILDEFERMFLEFASESVITELDNSSINVKYSNFQELLKEIVSVDILPSMSGATIEDLLELLKTNQKSNLERLTTQMLSNDNLVKITLGNPREIDTYVLGGYTNTYGQNLPVNTFDESQVLPNGNNVVLYLGEDLDGYYVDFFRVNNIELNEENIKQFRFIVYIYAGLRSTGKTYSKEELVNYLNTNIITNQNNQLGTYLKLIIKKFKDLKYDDGKQTLSSGQGYNEDPVKLELYNYFKSFNDKWVAGNSLGQRLLMEEFLFLDRANKDIGGLVYLDMIKLLSLTDKRNVDINLYNAITLLIQDSGFDIRVIPAYVNFYETSQYGKNKVTPSKTIAQTMFGTFLEVDYQEATPKTILQYLGPLSKHPEMEDISKNFYKFKNDGFNIGNSNKNPIIITPDIFRGTDFSRSNKVVAFEVSFGDQNQSIFKSVALDQTTIRNTSESFKVLERLGTTETGSSTAQIDIGLFDIYRQSSYQCEVTCMGNVMIQPTMYFYLKNVPLFRGSYWITEVTHNIKSTGIETTFKGTRIPRESLPKPEDSFLASYRAFFDRISAQAKILTKAELSGSTTTISGTSVTNTSTTIITNKGSFTTDMGKVQIPGETLIREVGKTDYEISYNGINGYSDIQMVDYQGEKWLRAFVKGINVSDSTSMTMISKPKTTWGMIKQYESTQDFYIAHFDSNTPYVVNHFSKTEFLNPNRTVQIPRTAIFPVTTHLDPNTNNYSGPISAGTGISLSKHLMYQLGVNIGEVIYFRMIP